MTTYHFQLSDPSGSSNVVLVDNAGGYLMVGGYATAAQFTLNVDDISGSLTADGSTVTVDGNNFLKTGSGTAVVIAGFSTSGNTVRLYFEDHPTGSSLLYSCIVDSNNLSRIVGEESGVWFPYQGDRLPPSWGAAPPA
jgi:hypothetical protein